MIQLQKQTTTLLMNLCGCASWSAPVLLQITEDRFSQSGSNCYPWTLRKHGKYDDSGKIVICAVSSKHLQFVCRHTKSYPAGDCFLYNMGCIRCISLQVYNKTLYTKVNMVFIELYKPRVTHMKYIEGNKEFSKSKTTKLFYFTRDSRLIFLSYIFKYAIVY